MLKHSNQLKPLDDQQTSQNIVSIKHSYGNLITLFPDQRGEPRFMLGPHYPLFFIAFLICSGLMGLLNYNFFFKFSLFWKIVVVISTSSFLLSYLKIGFSRPGIARAKGEVNQQTRQFQRFCHICQLVRERKTEHCADCNICIEGYDHHCPWIGKCVGKQNLLAFYIFLGCTFLNIVIVFVATATVNVREQANLHKTF